MRCRKYVFLSRAHIAYLQTVMEVTRTHAMYLVLLGNEMK